jgi:hypothetical protein
MYNPIEHLYRVFRFEDVTYVVLHKKRNRMYLELFE